MNTTHMTNRLKMAERLEAFLRQHLPTATAQILLLLDEDSWERIAAQAGEKNPSEATVSAVVALVRGREVERENGLATAVQALLERP